VGVFLNDFRKNSIVELKKLCAMESLMEDLMIDYFADGLPPEQLEQLQNWVKASPENEKRFRTMRDIWLVGTDVSAEQPTPAKREAFERFLTYTGSMQGPIRRKKQQRTVLRSVAAIALVCLTTYGIFQIGSKTEHPAFADNTSVEVAWGSQVKTTLPDGTAVWLNAGSELTYSQTFGISDRRVYLIGEGYFEVTHNENLPFSVQAGDLQINVLGTKFNVRNHLDDLETTVSLLEGSVSIANSIGQNEGITIEPNQKLFFNRENGDIHLTEVVASHTIEWTRGYLHYDGMLLSDIAKDLERSYDINITVHPDVANVRFVGRFNRKTMSAEEIIGFLASTGRITYSVTGQEIVIR
jgi:ferric-dicitrate binding protein FerR (iron transport regulator)